MVKVIIGHVGAGLKGNRTDQGQQEVPGVERPGAGPGQDRPHQDRDNRGRKEGSPHLDHPKGKPSELRVSVGHF